MSGFWRILAREITSCSEINVTDTLITSALELEGGEYRCYKITCIDDCAPKLSLAWHLLDMVTVCFDISNLLFLFLKL